MSCEYRKAVFTRDIDEKLREICEDIALRYEIEFLEIGTAQDHVHFFVQSVPMYSPKKIVQIIKSITAREIFKQMPEVKKELWGGQFWSDGYFVSTVGAHSSKDVTKQYVKNQEASKESIQPRLF
jgi:putative transposase